MKKQNTERALEKAQERQDKSKKVGSLSYIWKSLTKNPAAMAGLIFLCFIVIMSFLSPYIIKYSYSAVNLADKFAKPSWTHPFGCDSLGRDMLIRVFYGARYTLAIGLGATGIAAVSGVLIGALAGYFGGFLDNILMRFVDVVQSFPYMILAIALAAAFGQGLANCIYAIGIALMPVFARLIRANIFAIRGSEFIEAATSINCSTSRTIFRHVIPNTISPIIVQVSMSIAAAGLSAAALSFLGLGVKEPFPEWGLMLSTARSFMRDYPHIVIIPGVFIVLTVLSLNLIGDALRDALDPKLKI